MSKETTIVPKPADCPERVAYDLMFTIAKAEGNPIDGYMSVKPGREYILQTYAECLSVVKDPSRYRKDGKYEAKSIAGPVKVNY